MNDDKLFTVDTIVRRRFHVEARTKRDAERLANAVLAGRVQPVRQWAQCDVEGSEVLAGVYVTDLGDELEEEA